MKKQLLNFAFVVNFSLFLTLFPSIGRSQEYYFFESDSYPVETVDKLSGGVTNILSSWLEIPKNVINTTNEANLLFGLTGGLLKGFINTGGRFLVGVVEIVTFPVPTKPVTQPVLVWDDFDASTTYGEVLRLRD